MSTEYRDLLATPHARGFLVTGFIGRMPISMLGVAIVLLVTAVFHSYTLAGALSGCILLAQAVTSAWSGRLIDRLGRRRVLLPIVLAHTAGLLGILLCCLLRGPAALLLLCGLAAGATFPPIGAMVRSRWTEMLTGPGAPGSPRLATALSLEAAIDEFIFIVGPMLTTTAAALVTWSAGFLLAMVCALVGGVLFATRPGGDPAPDRTGTSGQQVISIPAIRVVAVVCVAVGAVLGAIEVTIVAFSREHGSTLLAGPLVAAFSVGSLTAGLIYGSRTWRRSPAFRFVAVVSCMLVGTVPIILSPNVPILAVSVVIAGCAVSPTLITGYELIQRLVPAENLTEGYTWIQTTLGLGLGLGVAAAGAVTDAFDAHTAFLVAGAAAVLAVLLAVPFRSSLNGPPTPDHHGSPAPSVEPQTAS